MHKMLSLGCSPSTHMGTGGSVLGPMEESAGQGEQESPNSSFLASLQLSSICRAALHAGVVRSHGGYVDVMPVDKRKTYTASFQNGIFSER